jgi:hypothetical protein
VTDASEGPTAGHWAFTVACPPRSPRLLSVVTRGQLHEQSAIDRARPDLCHRSLSTSTSITPSSTRQSDRPGSPCWNSTPPAGNEAIFGFIWLFVIVVESCRSGAVLAMATNAGVSHLPRTVRAEGPAVPVLEGEYAGLRHQRPNRHLGAASSDAQAAR